ncbi:MAG: heavy metal translocating P-type ATPase metal-binding domain-containing protein [Bacteroidetes bacterium]|nr:heavy metal translocating P-type ATPase metal-binding domain-containing protein [Bacteroidota bacterium]
MQTARERNTIIISKQVQEKTLCYHCGVPCINSAIHIDQKIFCCEGCKLVYEILNENGLCNYYNIQSHPGLSQIKPIRNDKYAYLDNEDIAKRIYKFTDGKNIIVTFYIPGVHCSSCMWLLEHMHKLNGGITESRLNFTTKELTIHFTSDKISLRKVVELLATIGYEPYISLEDAGKGKIKYSNKARIYKLGVAGFCFGNIMMMSFPEYLSIGSGIEEKYALLFRVLNMVLAVPVFFYCASEFFVSAWRGLKQKTLNIDAPIALALIITYTRSIYEISTGVGSGYLDSMSGIVFFMLVGRIVQDRTYSSISFHRDYKAYFPIAVNVITPSGQKSKNLQDLKEKDIILLYNDEIVPADAVLLDSTALVDYSFVTGESEPVTIQAGNTVYAGGRLCGEQVRMQVVKPVAGSYLTSLWNHHAFTKNKAKNNADKSIIHALSRYFTYILFALAAITAIYWAINDPSKILPSVSAMLIVACPCALLLSATYTNGNILRILSNNGLFLRDPTVIEQIGKIDQLVFDKTGTLTENSQHFSATGHQLSEQEKEWVYNTVVSSRHPYAQAIANWIGIQPTCQVKEWVESRGKGIEALINNERILIGSAMFVGVVPAADEKANVYVRINDNITSLHVKQVFREAIPQMMPKLRERYTISLLSGDNDKQRGLMHDLLGDSSELLFGQKPIDKLHYIERLQSNGKHVLMIGDGLNDAGALQQSDVGITLADDINNFTPSCDAILDANKFKNLPAVLKLAAGSKRVIALSFIISIVYNIVGLTISMKGLMAPMIAAILMPVSTLSIVLITTGASSLLARRLGLSLRDAE